MTFMVNDTICQFHEDMEAISGKEILAKFLQAFLGASTYCKIEVNSGYSSGAVVVFKRIDRMAYSDENPNMREAEFDVTGVFWLKEGKICQWRDYAAPGGVLKKTLIGD